jgi:putative ABC transport system permease protein
VTFALRMAWRETRAAIGRLLFFFVCVALGVAAIIVLRSVVQNVRTTLTREARYLVGADLVVQSSQPWTGDRLTRLSHALDEPVVIARTDVIETQTMASAQAGQGTGHVRLVEIRGISRDYPFYGRPELDGGAAYSHDLLANHGALVQPDVLTELGLSVGDALRLGNTAFTIRGVVTRDRVQRGGGFTFGPRVYVDIDDLRAMPLLGFGSRATYEVLVRADESSIVRLSDKLKQEFRRDAVNVRSWKGVEDRIGQNLTLAENYLSLVGFAMVVLGGIGVWSVTRVLVQQKIKSVAILKCVGASSRQVLATYLLQVGILAAGGSVLGIALAAVAVAAIPQSVLTSLSITDARVTVSAAVQGVAVGLLVSLLFALVPLLEIRRVKPLLLLRADTMSTARKRDWLSWGAGVAMAVALALVAIWQADSLTAGLYVSGGLGIVGLALVLAGKLIVRVLRPLTRSKWFPLRHAVISLGRPGNQTRVILLSVGLGCFFMLGVRAVQQNLLGEISVQVGPHAPDLVLFDIQSDQVDGVRAAVAPFVRQTPRMMPLMRARVVGVDGRRTNLPNAEDVRKQGQLTREYGVTFRDRIQDNEQLIAGTFWSSPLATEHTADGLDTEVSIEELVRNQAGVDVGDVMRFDVAGQVLTARVTSIRKVTWDEAQNGGFVFVLRPSPAVDRAAHNYVGFVEVSADPSARTSMQRALVAGFPNVSILDVRDVLGALKEVVDNVTTAVTVVGAVTLAGGILILVGAVAMTKFQRLYEAAIYRTLGAGTRLLGSMLAIEYGLIGLVAGALGAAGALALSWAMARGLFDITWRPAPLTLTTGVAITAVAVVAIGLVASAEVLMQKPLGTLRRE